MQVKFSQLVLFFVFVGLIVLYFVTMPFSLDHRRYTLYFLNIRTGKVGTEARFTLKNNNKQREIELVEELILGPMNHDYYDFFKKDTKYNSCFVDENTLYVSFPKSILQDIQEKLPFEQFYKLFEKNIFENCSNLKEVCMFLDGDRVYEISSNIADSSNVTEEIPNEAQNQSEE